MRVHHLNCASMMPSFLPAAVSPLVCHVLLCESERGLVLVDTGFGTDDYFNLKRLGPAGKMLRPQPDLTLTAVRQVEAMGHNAADVTDIVITHMDLDHIGGIVDFPAARIHTTADEHAAAVTNPDWHDKRRYRSAQWAHGPVFELHHGRGDEWLFGLTGHEVIPGITLVPMPGHSRGHAAVAVDAGERGLIVQAGDAVFDASSYGATSASGQPLERVRLLRAFEKSVGRDRKAMAANHLTLARLNREDGVTVVNAHDRRVMPGGEGGEGGFDTALVPRAYSTSDGGLDARPASLGQARRARMMTVVSKRVPFQSPQVISTMPLGPSVR